MPLNKHALEVEQKQAEFRYNQLAAELNLASLPRNVSNYPPEWVSKAKSLQQAMLKYIVQLENFYVYLDSLED